MFFLLPLTIRHAKPSVSHPVRGMARGVSFDIIVRFGIFFFSFVEYYMINLISDKSYLNKVQCGIYLFRFFFFSSVGYLKSYSYIGFHAQFN